MTAARIRQLDADEHDAFADALAATGQPGVAADLFLSDPRSHAFVATGGADGPAIGVAYGTEILRPEGFWMFVLQRLVVTDEARASGLGRDLLEAVKAFAETKGLRSMWLTTDAGSEAARKIYPRAGGERHDDGSYWWVFE